MGSYTKLAYHIIFGTKHRNPTIQDDVQEHLYEYIGGILRERNGKSISINGTADHIHLLAMLPPTVLLANVVRDVKELRSPLRGFSDFDPRVLRAAARSYGRPPLRG